MCVLRCRGHETSWRASRDKLESEFLAELKAIKHDLAHLAALARADAAVQKLESVQQARGIDKAMEMYVRQELPRRKDEKGKRTTLRSTSHTFLRCALHVNSLHSPNSP